MKKNFINLFIGVVLSFLGIILLFMVINGISLNEKKLADYITCEAVVKDVIDNNKYDELCKCQKTTYDYILVFEYDNILMEAEISDYQIAFSENTKLRINYNLKTGDAIIIRTSASHIALYCICILLIIIGLVLICSFIYENYFKKTKKGENYDK